MQVVSRLIDCVSDLCSSRSDNCDEREIMGNGSQTEIGEDSENIDGGTGESARIVGASQSEIQSEEMSGGQPKAMRESVIVALIISRVIEFYSLQSSRRNEFAEILGLKSESRREDDEGSGSKNVIVTQELQTIPVDILQTVPLQRRRVMPRSKLPSIPETGESSGSTGTDEESVRLITCWFSPFAHCVAISLREKGVRYVVIEESVLNKNDRTLNANPLNKRIPLLIHMGRVISEPRIIMEYIDEAWPGSPSALLPKDPFERSAARYWSDYIDKKISQRLLLHIGMNVKEVYETINDALIGLNKAMTVISHGKLFFMGDRLGLVDIVFAPMIPWFQVLQKLDNYKIPDATRCPRLHEWLSALEKHPSVRPSLQASSPTKLREFIVERFRDAQKREIGNEASLAPSASIDLPK